MLPAYRIGNGEGKSVIKKLRRAGIKQTQSLSQSLSASDTKLLARLVAKYGSKVVADAAQVVADAAQKVPLRGRGRPSRGSLPDYERMHIADWIEERAEEHRQAGSRKPYTDAEIDLYDLLYSGEEHRRDLQKFRKTIKKTRQQGRRDWLELARKIQEHPKSASEIGLSSENLPRWLVGRK